MRTNFVNLTNKKFHHLTALEEAGKSADRHILWKCVCDCGNFCYVPSSALTKKSTTWKSCGCERKKHMSYIGKTYWRKNNCGISKSATKFLDIVEQELKITIQREFPITNRLFDGRYKNFLIEVDGSYWHRTKRQLANDKIKEGLAKQAGFTLLRIPVRRLNEAVAKAKLFVENGILQND